jgi:hypothetical protein
MLFISISGIIAEDGIGVEFQRRFKTDVQIEDVDYLETIVTEAFGCAKT